MVFQGSSKDVFNKFQGCFKEVSMNFKMVTRKLQRCFKEDSKVFEESFRGASNKIERFLGFF